MYTFTCTIAVMLKNKKTVFACFSPPVMLATFMIEIVLLVALLLSRKLNSVTKLIATTLFFLAFFQLAEYFVCGGLGVDAKTWSRLGFVAITTLPPLGLHLVHAIAGKKPGWIVRAGYGLMLLWIILFGFTETAFNNHICVSNYVIFNLHNNVMYYYSAYYYSLLLLGIWLAYRFARDTKKKPTQQALHGMIVGYLVFLVPTATANVISPSTMDGIPSIMCGFAVLFALILFFYIAPRVAPRKK